MAKSIELVLECMKEKKMTQTELARSLGEDVRIINQQLNRQKDIKAERFLEIMEHIGYRVEIVDNCGIRKIGKDTSYDIGTNKDQEGLFYADAGDGRIVGIYCVGDKVKTEIFGNKEDCFRWLLSCA